jgi:hypothetical protein
MEGVDSAITLLFLLVKLPAAVSEPVEDQLSMVKLWLRRINDLKIPQKPPSVG